MRLDAAKTFVDTSLTVCMGRQTGWRQARGGCPPVWPNTRTSGRSEWWTSPGGSGRTSFRAGHKWRISEEGPWKIGLGNSDIESHLFVKKIAVKNSEEKKHSFRKNLKWRKPEHPFIQIDEGEECPKWPNWEATEEKSVKKGNSANSIRWRNMLWVFCK